MNHSTLQIYIGFSARTYLFIDDFGLILALGSFRSVLDKAAFILTSDAPVRQRRWCLRHGVRLVGQPVLHDSLAVCYHVRHHRHLQGIPAVGFIIYADHKNTRQVREKNSPNGFLLYSRITICSSAGSQENTMPYSRRDICCFRHEKIKK